MQCPNCGHMQDDTRSCAGCGINFEKFRALQATLREAEGGSKAAEPAAVLPQPRAPRHPVTLIIAALMVIGFAVAGGRLWDFMQDEVKVPTARKAVELYRATVFRPLRQYHDRTGEFAKANWQLELPPPEDRAWTGFDKVAVVGDGRTVISRGAGADLFALVIYAAPPEWDAHCGGFGIGEQARRSLADFCTWDASLSTDIPEQPEKPKPEPVEQIGPSAEEHQEFVARFEMHLTPLMEAADHGDEAGVRSALAGGAPVDARDRYGNSALMYAARAASPGAVQALLDAGADVRLKNQNSVGAWAWALTRKIGPVAPADPARQQARVAVLGLLLAHGVQPDLNAIDETGRTLLHRAADEGDVAMIHFLVAHSASLELRDAEGRTPLMRAALLPGSDEPLEALVQAGARAMARDSQNRTVLDLVKQQLKGPEGERRYGLLLDAMKHPDRVKGTSANHELEKKP